MKFEIFFPCDFPNNDNNLSIFLGAKEEPDVKAPRGMTGTRREKGNQGSLSTIG